jgi:hypothetical protein
MKTLLLGILAGMVLSGISPALDTTAQQNGQIPAAQADQSSTSGAPKIAPGSVIPVQLTKTIDAKKAKTGDPVEAKVTQDLKTGNGDVVVPKDTKVIGRVTEAQPRNKEQKESQVGIAFDHAIMKNGAEMSLPMSIQAIIAPPNPNAGNNYAGESAGQPPSMPSGGGMPPSNNSGRMGAGTQQQSPSSSGGRELPASPQPGNKGNQPITEKTQGVVGMSNLQLSPAATATEGSIVSSEKNNVKLDSGTLMLLRVNQ